MISNILFIDENVIKHQLFVQSVNSSTLPIVYSKNTTRNDILELLRLNGQTTIDRIGICFEISPITTFLDDLPFLMMMVFTMKT